MLEDVGTRVKSIPPVVWLVGGIVVVGAFILTRGGSGGGTAGVQGSPGGAGGDFSPDQGQQIVDLAQELHQAEADLQASIAQQNAANAAFQKSVTDQLNKVPAAGGGATGVIKPIINAASFSGGLQLWSANHTRVSIIHSGTLNLVRVGSHGDGRFWYKITSGRYAGRLVLLKPSQVPGPT